jgi:2-keto-4-pentenoate hydratase/2-oxohepta-3-ene-1,7-dioic acid hydratase in catechol pathway
MRVSNLRGRAVVIVGDRAVDIAGASEGRFGPAPRDVLDSWNEFRAWAELRRLPEGEIYAETDLGPPVPDPRQVFAIGLNYRDHAEEAGLAHPEELVVFTKFVSSLAGPTATVDLPSDFVDYETELVAVIGREVHGLSSVGAAADAVAGYCVGQDYSERVVQMRGPAPQFSLAKSFPGFSPFGPAIVTLDELADPSGLRITARISGPTADALGVEEATLQDGSTSDLLFSVDRIVYELSQVVTLFPGDVIFTGTPAGVGGARGIFLKAGDRLVSTIEGLGALENTFARASTTVQPSTEGGRPR